VFAACEQRSEAYREHITQNVFSVERVLYMSATSKQGQPGQACGPNGNGRENGREGERAAREAPGLGEGRVRGGSMSGGKVDAGRVREGRVCGGRVGAG
jgi:hypothetical protein